MAGVVYERKPSRRVTCGLHHSDVECSTMQHRTNVRVTFSLPQSAYDHLLAMAEEGGVSVSWVVRYAVDDLIRRQGDGRQGILPLRRSREMEESGRDA